MKFRPCIDIHNGKVKQIVGGSLKDEGDMAQTNFTSEQDAAWYAEKYKQDGLKGGHIILLNSRDSEYFEATKEQALLALSAYPGGMQIGGGITADVLVFIGILIAFSLLSLGYYEKRAKKAEIKHAVTAEG